MNPLTAPCGLDCATCEAYQATQIGDTAAQRRIIAQWREQFHAPDMPPEAATCDGCSSEGRHGGYTVACPVRRCAQERQSPTCAHCADYAVCPTLAAFLTQAACLREKLEAIRVELGRN
jgi:hypothetical protein